MQDIAQSSRGGAQALITQILHRHTTDHPEVTPSAGEHSRQQTLSTLFREWAHITHHASVRRPAIAEREDDSVPSESPGLVKRCHDERLVRVSGDEVCQLGAGLGCGGHRFVDPGGMFGTGRQHHQRFCGPGHHVVNHVLHHGSDFSINSLNQAGLRIRHPVSVLEMVHHQRGVPQVASRPRHGLLEPAVKGGVDHASEFIAARSIALGQRQGGDHLRERGKQRIFMTGVAGRLVAINPDSQGELCRCLSHRVPHRDDLRGATQSPHRLSNAERTRVHDHHHIEAHGVGQAVHLIGGCDPDRRQRFREVWGE